MTDVNIFVAFAAGVLSFLSPCVLPLIPSYLSFVSGVSLDEMRSEQARARVRWRVVLNSLAFIVGFSLVFISLGASASFLGGVFLGYRNAIRILGGAFILLVGLYLVGLFKIAALDRYLQFNLKDKPAGYLGSILVGITFAVAWTPCVGPILGATLAPVYAAVAEWQPDLGQPHPERASAATDDARRPSRPNPDPISRGQGLDFERLVETAGIEPASAVA